MKIKNKKKYLFLVYLKVIVFIIFFIYFIINSKKYFNLINKKNKRKYKIISISYGNKYYKMQLKLNKKSALEIGKVDEYYSYGPEDIDKEFRKKNKIILSKKRGNGYWLWKPYFIYKTFKDKLKEGDYLIYTDAAILYMNSTYKIIEFLEKQKAEMWMIQLGNNCIEKRYTKRDAFILLGADSPFYTDTNQFMAGIQVYKKSKYTEKFLEELLYYSQDKRIITDEPNTQGYKNYKEFRDNRHDQTVLSLLIKKYGEANSGKTNLNINLIKKNIIIMPYIFCIYRRTHFINYNDIRNKCINHIKDKK